MIYKNLGFFHYEQKDYSQASAILTDLLAIRRSSYSDQPDHADIVLVLTYLTDSLNKLGNINKSIELIDEFITQCCTRIGKLTSRKDIAWLLNNLALYYQSVSNFNESFRHFKESIDMFRKIDPSKRDQPEVACVLHNLALVLRARQLLCLHATRKHCFPWSHSILDCVGNPHHLPLLIR